MSVNIDRRVVAPGSDEYVDDAWELKEEINRLEGVLKQRHNFFTNAYRRSTVHCSLQNGELIGFAAVRRDGYVLFLAVAPAWQGEGIGRELLARVAEDHDAITCHARATNEDAIEFYQHLGFEITRRVDDYYEDGGDAYYLKLGANGGLADRLSDLIRR